MVRSIANDGNYVWVLEEDQATVAVVIGESAEGLRSQGNVGVQFTRRVEREGHRGSSGGSVHAAHAVDGDLLDEKLFNDLRLCRIAGAGGLSVADAVLLECCCWFHCTPQ
jgi:hypothetical protein